LKHISKIFNFSEELRVQRFDDFIVMNAGKRMIKYEKLTGIWSFQDTSYDKYKNHELPSDEEAITVARNFLKENDLYNERFTIGTVVTQYSGSELDSTYAPYSKSVFFYPQINDCSILGNSRMFLVQ